MYALSKAQAGDICTIKWMFGLPEAVDFSAPASRGGGRDHTGYP